MGQGASSESGGIGSGQQTPAPESESVPRTDTQGDVETRDTEQEGEEGDVSMADDGEHRRTDHEREEGEDAVPPLPEPNALYKFFTERKYLSFKAIAMLCARWLNLHKIQRSHLHDRTRPRIPSSSTVCSASSIPSRARILSQG